MKGVDYMLIAITVYLMIGGIIMLWVHKELGDVVEGESLATKVGCYAFLVLVAPLCVVCGFVRAVYDTYRANKLES